MLQVIWKLKIKKEKAANVLLEIIQEHERLPWRLVYLFGCRSRRYDTKIQATIPGIPEKRRITNRFT